MSNKKLNNLFAKLKAQRDVHEALVWIQHETGETMFLGEHERTLKTPMLLASVSKLWTTACMLSLVNQKRVSLSDTLETHLESTWLTYPWVNRKTTVLALLTHQTGYPDYYLGAKTQIFKKVREEDFGFTRDDEFIWTETLKLKPMKNKPKAFYADINYTLLGLILESIHQKPLAEIFEEVIAKPLQLKKSFLPNKDDAIPHTYDGAKRFDRPMFISSCYASGGVISTAEELMIFIKAFFEGKIFDHALLDIESKTIPLQWSFYPIRYGHGHMMIPVKMPLKPVIELRGHAGSTGAFAYYCPQNRTYIVGDIPQINKPSRAVRFVMRAALESKT